MMCDGDNLSPVGQLDIYDVIGEPADENASDVCVRHAGDTRSGVWSCLDPCDYTADRTQEFNAETGLPGVVPARGLGHVGLRPGADTDGSVQRRSRSRSKSSRTSGHGLPGSSPDRARAARSSISTAQATSASSSASPSRLASSPEASSARCLALSFNASSRSLVVAFVTGMSLARLSSPNKALERPGARAPQRLRPTRVPAAQRQAVRRAGRRRNGSENPLERMVDRELSEVDLQEMLERATTLRADTMPVSLGCRSTTRAPQLGGRDRSGRHDTPAGDRYGVSGHERHTMREAYVEVTYRHGKPLARSRWPR